MKVNDIFVFKNSKDVPIELRGKTVKVVLNKPNPSNKDIPSFEHGFVHFEINNKYMGFCGEDWFKRMVV